MAARKAPAPASDSDISIVVWFARPMCCRSRSGSNPGDAALAKRSRNRTRSPRPPDVVAHHAGLFDIQHHEIGAAGLAGRLRGGGARLLVPDLAVDHRGETLLARIAARSSRRSARSRTSCPRERSRSAPAVCISIGRDAEGGQYRRHRRPSDRRRPARSPRKRMPELAQPLVDVRVVDDLAGEKDAAIGEALRASGRRSRRRDPRRSRSRTRARGEPSGGPER